ncbi:MAG: hypothetical protein ACFFDN_51360, partial [Candidatus Hodarchaeota archaeon]
SAKFKHYYLLCEGKVIDLSKNRIKTDIQQKDGLKEGMKLLIFDDQKPHEDFPFIGEAKVHDVQKTYSRADILKDFGVENNGNDILVDYAVITR